jgi:hypothetical protein
MLEQCCFREDTIAIQALVPIFISNNSTQHQVCFIGGEECVGENVTFAQPPVFNCTNCTLPDRPIKAHDCVSVISESGRYFDCTFTTRDEGESYKVIEVEIVNCDFISISSPKQGGSCRILGTVFIDNSSFINCSAQYGGGICVQGLGKVATLLRCKFLGCGHAGSAWSDSMSATSQGGALAMKDGVTLGVVECLFENNTDGCILVHGWCDVFDTIFQSNTGQCSGILLWHADGFVNDVTLAECKFIKNTGVNASRGDCVWAVCEAGFTATNCLFVGSSGPTLKFEVAGEVGLGGCCFQGGLSPYIVSSVSLTIFLNDQTCFDLAVATSGPITFENATLSTTSCDIQACPVVEPLPDCADALSQSAINNVKSFSFCIFSKRDANENITISEFSVIKCVFRDITTTEIGGGFAILGNVYVEETVFKGCSAPFGSGGAILDGLGSFVTCTFLSCGSSQSYGTGSEGGAIGCGTSAFVNVTNCVFNDGRNGCVAVAGEISVVNCSFKGCTGAYGGIHAFSANAVISLLSSVFVEVTGTATGKGNCIWIAACKSIAIDAIRITSNAGNAIHFDSAPTGTATIGTGCFQGAAVQISASAQLSVTVTGRLCFSGTKDGALSSNVGLSGGTVAFGCSNCDGSGTPTVESQSSIDSETGYVDPTDSSSKKLSTAVIAGIAAGSAVVLAAIVVVVIIILKRRRKRDDSDHEVERPLDEGESVPGTVSEGRSGGSEDIIWGENSASVNDVVYQNPDEDGFQGDDGELWG